MFGNHFSQTHEKTHKHLVNGNGSVINSITSDLNNSSVQNKSLNPHPYQTAQFKPGFSNLDAKKTESSEILTITIEIGPNQNETLSIRDGDDPYKLAEVFSRRHGISSEL